METDREDAALLAVARAVIGVATRAADELGEVSLVQLRALTVLSELKTGSLVQLAEGMGVTASTTSRLVDRLVAAGHAERRPSPESRRQIELRLTPEGEAVLRRYDELRLAGLREIVDRLPPDHRDGVLDAFEEFGTAASVLGAGGVVNTPEESRPRAPRPEEEGGDPACWLRRVCPSCGRLTDEDPPTRCPSCGEPIPAD